MGKVFKTQPTMIRAESEDGEFIGDAILDVSVQCLGCRHYHWGNLNCAAFPKGIAEGILNGEFDHTKPYKGDNSVRYEPSDADEDELN